MTIDWAILPTQVESIINEGAPFLEELVPGLAPAIKIASALLTGAANAEPTAVALVQSIQSGTVPTAAQLQTYATNYEDAYQQLNSDIAAQLKTAPTS